MTRELEHLAEIARAAGKIAQSARKTLNVEKKPDGSLVTNGDRDAELFLRRELIQLVPGSNVSGEEFGFENEGENGVWLVDPIDGTSNFSFGSPLWGNSIALYVGGEFRLAAIDLPDLGETYVAQLGHGSFVNEKPLPPIIEGPILPHELVSIGERALRDLGRAAVPGNLRYSGAFVIDGAWVASQRYRGLVGGGEHLYDAAASLLICQELGAVASLTDLPKYLTTEPLPTWTLFPLGATLAQPH